MTLIADMMLAFGAIAAAIYCMVLSRRLRKFNNLQDGMGGAVAVLSAQVDDMSTMLNGAQKAAEQSANVLTDLTQRAETASQKLELMMASLHDLPEMPEASDTPDQPAIEESTESETSDMIPKSEDNNEAQGEPEPIPTASPLEPPVKAASESTSATLLDTKTDAEETVAEPIQDISPPTVQTPAPKYPVFSSNRVAQAAQ